MKKTHHIRNTSPAHAVACCRRGRWPRSPVLQPSARAGFSLLEILLAVTVLIVIVMIISLVFQQAHNAWGAGTRKAGAETTLRSIMGVIEHDLTLAVDDAAFGGSLNSFPTPGASTASIEFVMLDGTNRLPQVVLYNFSGGDLTRSTIPLIPGSSPTNWVQGTQSAGVTLNGGQPLNICTFSVPSGTTSVGLPLRLEIETHVLKQGSFSIVSGWSEGRNRPGHPEDKIVVSP